MDMTKKILNVPILDVKIIYGGLDVMGTEYYIQQRLESGSVVDAYYGKVEKPTEIRNRNFLQNSKSFYHNRKQRKGQMQNQPYWDKTKREWVLEYKVNDKNIGEYVQRVRFETLASANAYLQMLNQRKTK